jgi:hypothetical protein
LRLSYALCHQTDKTTSGENDGQLEEEVYCCCCGHV